MTVAVVAEKPSVARDIARVLGARRRSDGALEGNGYVVTWAVGHLASLAQPHEIEARWKRWSFGELPMIPDRWPLRVYERTRPQFEIVKRILCDRKTEEIVCATDAGREGELIFRFVYEAAGATKPVRRLWISSLTDEAIGRGFADLRPAIEFDGLADAARGRSRADWLVGMNLSRAYTLSQQRTSEVLSVGRVQTPTLSMVVERELAIRDFVPEAYREVRAIFRPMRNRTRADPEAPSYEGVYVQQASGDPLQTNSRAAGRSERKAKAKGSTEGQDSLQRACRLPADGDVAQQIADRALRGSAAVHSVSGNQHRIPPPPLYDLTELQRHANRLYGESAQKTLDIAQSLYEKKLLSYPRTDSRALTKDVAQTLAQVVAAISRPYAAQLAEGTGTRALGPRFVNDSKVSDHHALIPTTTSPTALTLSPGEARIYDLVCRRLLAAWHEDHLYTTTTVITTITQPAEPEIREPIADHYRSTGTKLDRIGWRVLDPPHPATKRKASDGRDRRGSSRTREPGAGGDQQIPPSLEPGQPQQVLESQVDDKLTRPPRHFTEATLLTAMESAGKTLDDKELSQAMRECGLGTPATRAGIIETLLTREYIHREKKTLVASDKGIHLIALVHPHAKSPAMTGRWESQLRRIQEGTGTLEAFVSEIEQFVRDVVAQVEQVPPPATLPIRSSVEPDREATRHSVSQSVDDPGRENTMSPAGDASATAPIRTPTSPAKLLGLLQRRFGFERFRPYQEEVCRAITAGHDVLLVMPTGAGKSLCYQLPGIARAGTTLVVSPLIALMEDQVLGLQERGFAAERIHSGRSRSESRQVCVDYLAGRLDFLFIAPERLRVPGFPEMLARRGPALIAIDEAHCISQWGHDFRPDYRMLKERLPLLRPAPIVALTATATPRVQRDIVEQLAVHRAKLFIHGFRRENIGIEVVELKPSLRNETTARLLGARDRRPAIVYAPTRKKAEALADQLCTDFPAAAYHAGMDAGRRDRVQAAFFAGSLEVVVATVAFGMGIDKSDVRSVVHLALPGSVENYYQEIGRAGRDGLPARAFLLHGYVDRRTHEWFLDRDYPDPESLARVFDALGKDPIEKAQLQRAVRMESETFERALEKLWIHGGALVGPDESTTRGHDQWLAPYRAQLEHRRLQIQEMARFADSRSCRMLRLVRHFGDQADSGSPCGQCDICAPESTLAREYDEATPAQQAAMERILKTLASHGTPSSGRLCREVFGEDFDRNRFEGLLAALHRAGFIHIEDESFETEGRVVEFRRPVITASGRRANTEEIAEVQVPLPSRSRTPRRRQSGSRTRKQGARTKKSATTKPTSRSRRSPREKTPARGRSASEKSVDTRLSDRLRELRLAEAQRRGIPAFRIFGNKVLEAIAAALPRTREELLEIKGVGPALAKNYGNEILRLVGKTIP